MPQRAERETHSGSVRSATRSARTPTHRVLALQRQAGNAAVASLMGVQRSCACGCAGGGECAEVAVQRDDLDPGEGSPDGEAAGAPSTIADLLAPGSTQAKGITGNDVSAAIFGPACTPFTSRIQAESAWAFVSGSFIPFATGVLGPETAALWALYLDRFSAAIPRPRQTLSGRPTIRAGFTAHHKTAEAEVGLLDEVIAKVNDGTITVTPGRPTRMTLTRALGAGTITSMLNKGGSQEMGFDSVATTIAGNLAGGVGEGGPPGNTVTDPDTRDAGGMVEILVTPGAAGAPGTVSVTPQLQFEVHDTIDLCPGALGGALARAETVPMSRLERTEATLGPVFAADVPFDVTYPGPGVVRTGPHTPFAPPVPPVPPPTPIVLPTRVLFDFDSSALKPEGREVLTTLLPRLRSSPMSLIIGHADSMGSDRHNQGLSERRAQAVVAELVAQDPSLAGRLQAEGRGEREPVDTNDTAVGRANNRRVEVVFGP